MAPAPRRKLVDANVTDVLKRRYPSKHYVYVIQVTWDDGGQTVIFRRYSKFFDLQIGLLESFPKEGGLKDPSARTIPFLPGKILFRRSHIRDVAMKRLRPIDEYCRALVRLPSHISQSAQVLEFFESKPEDINPPTDEAISKRRRKDESVKRRPVRRTKSLEIGEISGPITLEEYVAVADFTRSQPKELSIIVGQHVEVIEKHENGWWFVSDEEGERGWVPGVYLEKQDGSQENLVTKESELGQGEKYITTAKFDAGNSDEVSFGVGVLVEVLQKNLEGWWLISYQGNQGWAPASYLDKAADAVLRVGFKNEHGVEIISSVNDIKNNRRSLPSAITNAVVLPTPAVPSALSNSASSSPHRHVAANRRSKDCHSACISSAEPFLPKPGTQIKPPPKRSSVKRNSTVRKPRVPPPLPPTASPAREPIYDYVATATFSADIQDGISFEKDTKLKVIEKSPGGWWFVEINGSEGWAPSSYIDKKFKSKEPPERPKLPKVAGESSAVAGNRASELRAKSSLGRSNSTGATSRNQDIAKIVSARRPVPQKPGHSSASQSAGRDDNSQVRSPLLTGSKQPAAAKMSAGSGKVAAAEVQRPWSAKPAKSDAKEANAASSDSRNHPKPTALASKPKENAPATKSVPPKRPLKPVLSGDSKTTAAVKTNSCDSAAGNKKQTPKPPAPPAALKKPVARRESPDFLGVGAEPGKVDFRSALKPLKPRNQTPAKNGVSADKRAPVMPPKPTPPAKANQAAAASNATSVTSLRSKFANGDSSPPPPPSKPKPPAARAKPPPPTLSSKPVLRRFHGAGITNDNNSNNTDDSPVEERVVVVGRVEVSGVTPPFLLRGSPDGQVDESALDENLREKQKLTVATDDGNSSSGAKTQRYIAVAEFVPEHPNEIGFPKGSEVLLIETSTSDWWYVKVGEQCGWAPSTYFELPSAECSPEKGEDAPYLTGNCAYDAIYSEINDYCISDAPLKCNRCVTIASFTASDETMLNIEAGDIVEVIEESDGGWWYVCVVYSVVSKEGQEGWVPGDHLQHL